MNFRTRVLLFAQRFIGKINRMEMNMIIQILEECASMAGDVKVGNDTYHFAVAKRASNEDLVRGTVKLPDGRRMAITEDGMKMVDNEHIRDIMEIIVEWNKQQRSKYASRYTQGRGSSVGRNGRKDSGGSDQGETD